MKQLPLNIKQKLEFSNQLIDGERLLPAIVRVTSFLADKPLDFYDTAVEVLNKVLHHCKSNFDQ